MGRIELTLNTYSPAPRPACRPGRLADIPSSPLSPSEAYAGLTENQRQRCPGANERNPGDGSTPFTENGTLDCDPTQVPPGP